VAEFDESSGQVLCIKEKPAVPKSDYAVTGLYIYNSGVFDVIKTLKPSRCGELEITDVNNEYIRRGEMGYSVLDGGWIGTGAMRGRLGVCCGLGMMEISTGKRMMKVEGIGRRL